MSQQLIKELARAAVVAAAATAASPATSMSPDAVANDAPKLQAEAERVIAANPTLQHVTNSEPWYQKRSRWSAIIGTIATVIAPLALKYGFEIGEAERELAATVLTVLGGLWAAGLAYRAGTARKPLGA